jgi:hypothetical protein
VTKDNENDPNALGVVDPGDPSVIHRHGPTSFLKRTNTAILLST